MIERAARRAGCCNICQTGDTNGCKALAMDKQ